MQPVVADSWYEELQWVNSFQYPPTKCIGAVELENFGSRLAMDQHMHSPASYTVFISIPYCRIRCHSCEYFRHLLPRQIDSHASLGKYLDCLEWQLQQYGATTRFRSAICAAVYIGGGTASLLTLDQVKRIVDMVQRHLLVTSNVEVTLEGNPRELATPGYLEGVNGYGINRLSIGFQSQQDDILRVLGSPHRAAEGITAIGEAMAAGFNTVNVDLLYRVPGQTMRQWEDDLGSVIEYSPEGITIYEYIVHSNSTAERLIAQGTLPKQVDRDVSHECYLRARARLQQAGYQEQRVGNFSKRGHEQLYAALTYGVGRGVARESIGLGPGAFSFINRYQFRAPKTVGQIMDQIYQRGFPVVEQVSLQADEKRMMERFIIFSFAASSLSRANFRSVFGQDPLAVFPDTFERLATTGLVVINEESGSLSDQGIRWRYNVFREFYAHTAGKGIPC